MSEELRSYLEELFKDAPKTKAAYELKEELIANSTERYLDLLKDSVPEKEALNIVIHSIGDVNQLFAEVESPMVVNQPDEAMIKKTALMKSIAIGMYILGVALAIGIDELTIGSGVGPILMLVMAGLATSLLVYTNMAYPKYKKMDDTMVEEFKEWKHNKGKNKAVRNSVYLIIWMVIVILYFLASFLTMAWHITWLLFLAGACAHAIAVLVFNLKESE